MATRDGLCRYDGHTFKVFQPNSAAKTSLSFPDPLTLKLDHSGHIWIRSYSQDLDWFDPVRETFVNFSHQPFYQRNFGRDSLHLFYPDGHNRLWLYFAKQGLVSVDLRTNRFQSYRHQPHDAASISQGSVGGIVEDKQGRVWVATASGLDRFDEQTRQFTHYKHDPNNPRSLPDNQLTGLYQHPNGSLVVLSQRYLTLLKPTTGQCANSPLAPKQTQQKNRFFFTDSKGNGYFYYYDELFRLDEKSGLQRFPIFPGSSMYISLFIDRSDVLWAGTNGRGVFKYDLNNKQFDRYPYQVSFHTDLLVNQLGVPSPKVARLALHNGSFYFRYTFDQDKRLMFNVGKSPFHLLNLQTKQLTTIPFPVLFDGQPTDQSIPLATDPGGTIWTVCKSELWRYDKQAGKWIHVSYPQLAQIKPSINQLVVDPHAFWLSTSDGLYRLDRTTGILRSYRHEPKNNASLSSNNLYCLSSDPVDDNILWIGTFGNGLCRFDKRTGTSRRLTTDNGLPNNVIYSAIPDQKGYLWIGTNKGLCRLNKRTLQTQTYTTQDGLIANEFNRYHFLHLPNDRIILGGIEGITAFEPSRVRNDTYQPKVELTNLLVNNRPVNSETDSSIVGLPAHALTKIVLAHNRNDLNIEFAVIQFNRLKKNLYRYRMEGLDKDWIIVNHPEAVYTDLEPGRYTLIINASNYSGFWSNYCRKLDIIVQPPWWATWWAYGLYSVLVALILYGLLRSFAYRLSLHQSIQIKQKEVELKEQEAQQLKGIDELKTRFFTNVTHEFKTPLTLILAPAQLLRKELDQTNYIHQLDSIEHNANQLLRLTNQLMDLAKVEAKIMQVHESCGSPGMLVEQVVNSFSSLAQQKTIQLDYENQLSNDYQFDSMLLERIVYNLLSNALKFTPDGGHVTVCLAPHNGITLTVTDTGVGIPFQQLPSIFDRFFQAGTPATRQNEGTGIGLSLVKELVELQGGTIHLESTEDPLPNRRGTVVTVRLPYQLVEPLETEQIANTGSTPRGEGRSSAETPVILLVEDNANVANLIVDSLQANYYVTWVKNGLEGMSHATSQIPDLIISDVLMPVMDGYTLCQNLKADPRTNHIPIILLTAKSSVDSRLEGLATGADDYITKPFLIAELQLRVRNLLERQQRFRELIHADLTGIDQPALTEPVENSFLTKIYSLVETKLDDSTYGVEELASDIGMSRYTLHRKIKTLTTLLPNELIRNYRLKRSLYFLQKGYTIAETATLVGFDSASYFTKCFRNLYGVTPSKIDQIHYKFE
ncbi:ATP-binding protein [Spirosoma sp. RP8]|uniref:histidine kinase n=1 Tax=Spirosoma liriopis TaxID=2937440 RepID=A0ABT0HU66_9BACT|nr:hybrid sensor histidine kinase/response regulator transcription factor [Spirosoma liriopis]MCK8495737.1 ATP-binding protein [Spirosoma liriopis]